jgi:uncharacterized protein YecT (DUF1311 family)
MERKQLRENTDFYPSMAIGIRRQIRGAAHCRPFASDGLMFPPGELHLRFIGFTAGVNIERDEEMGTVSDTFTLKFAAAISAAALAALAVMASQAGQAAAQEFDCREAASASERTICRSDALAALDEKMGGLYAELKQSYARKGQRDQLKRYQRQFLAARDDCARDTECIKGAYLDQISVLEAQLERNDRQSER